MQTKTKFEEEILKEIQGMPVSLQKKIAKIIHFFKQEIVDLVDDETRSTEQFLSVCGKWKDTRTVQEQIEYIYSTRRSRTKMERLS